MDLNTTGNFANEFYIYIFECYTTIITSRAPTRGCLMDLEYRGLAILRARGPVEIYL